MEGMGWAGSVLEVWKDDNGKVVMPLVYLTQSEVEGKWCLSLVLSSLQALLRKINCMPFLQCVFCAFLFHKGQLQIK